MSEYKGAEKTAEVCMIWPTAAADQMGKIIEQCHFTDRILSVDGRIAGNASVASKAGFVAEEVHAETYNFDAILNKSDTRAFTDRYHNPLLGNNDPVSDIVIAKDGKSICKAQLKYYKDGKSTANAFKAMDKHGHRHYKEADILVGPADQLEDIKAAAHHSELRERGHRPQEAEAAREVQSKASDRISVDGNSSKKLSKAEAEQIAKEAKNGEGKGAHRKIQDSYKNRSTIQQTAKAAAGAAIVTTVIAGTINTVSCLRKVQSGQMSPSDAMKYILKNTAIAASDSALKAAGATAAVSLTTRALPNMFTGSVLQTNLATGAVGGAAVCAIDLVECLVMVAAGKMTWQELETRTGKNIFQTGAGVVGATIGATLGAAGGPLGAAAGAIIGGMITSVAATVAIENHIEKPFREIMDNTRSLAQAETLMSNAMNYLSGATVVMEDFKKGLYLSQVDFEKGMALLRQKRVANWNLINNLK